MKRNLILLTVLALLLLNSIIFAFTVNEEFNVFLQIHPYAVIETPEELNIYLFDQDQDTNIDSGEFSIRSNFALNLDVESGGFHSRILNNNIRYFVNDKEIVPGSTEAAIISMEEAGYQTALFSVVLYELDLIENEGWEHITADTVSDLVVFTVSAL